MTDMTPWQPRSDVLERMSFTNDSSTPVAAASPLREGSRDPAADSSR